MTCADLHTIATELPTMSMCAEEAWLERQLIKMGGLLGLWRGTGEMNIFFYEQIDFHCEKLKKAANQIWIFAYDSD